MVIYSSIPEELIFEQTKEINEQNKKFREINFSQGTLIVEDISPGKSKIVRVLSTNPQVYLNSKLQPGNFIVSDHY